MPCPVCGLTFCVNESHRSFKPKSVLVSDTPLDLEGLWNKKPDLDEMPPLIGDEDQDRPVLLFDINRQRTTDEVRERSVERYEPPVERFPCPTFVEEVGLMSNILQIPLGKPNKYPIPKIVHRFWTGGPMRQGAMDNLLVSIERLNDAGWKSCLWYSSTVEAMLDFETINEKKQQLRAEQRYELHKAGYAIRAIEDLAPDFLAKFVTYDVTKSTLVQFAKMAARSVLQGRGFDDVKYFSDFCRLYYLHQMGGFHIDVDMGLGDMDLTVEYYHNDPKGEIPLLGTLARDSSNKKIVGCLRLMKSWRKKGSAPLEAYKKALATLVNQAVQGSIMFNGLIAMRDGTTHCKEAIVYYKQQFLEMGPVSGMFGTQKILVCRNPQPKDDDKLLLAMKYTVPPYVLRLDQVTDESDAGAGLKKKD
jgi:hypothetical protein